MNKILVVEDSRVIIKILKRLIARDNEVQQFFAESYAETSMLCKKHGDFSGALVDLHLPDAPNGEALEYVLSKKIPTVVLTTEQSEEKRRQWFDAGIVDYVVKESRYSYEYAISVLKRLDINKSQKILIVDDSNVSRNFMRNALRPHGFKIYEAENGKQGMQILQSEGDIRLVLTDYHMPTMDGIQLAQRARMHFPRTKLGIIGLSSNEDKTLSVKFIKHGANDFLHKPFATEELLCRVLHNLDLLHLVDKIEDEADRDYLTGLNNRRFLFRQSEKVLKHARSSKASLSLAVIDIDHFKKINDSYGHECGDAMLRLFSKHLARHFSNYILARVGGEEFCVVMPGVKSAECLSLLERLRVEMRDTTLNWGEQTLRITFSAGIVDEISDSLSTMINRADEELYRAKHAGRDCIKVADNLSKSAA